jgi:hypothetical protein
MTKAFNFLEAAYASAVRPVRAAFPFGMLSEKAEREMVENH